MLSTEKKRGSVVFSGLFYAKRLPTHFFLRLGGQPAPARPTAETADRAIVAVRAVTERDEFTLSPLIFLTPGTLARLEELAAKIRQQSQVAIEPMQLAGLLLEKATEQVSDAEAEKLLRTRTGRH